MSKRITCIKGCRDANGNQRYLYNFIDTTSTLPQKELNRLFNYFGRLTDKGISSHYTSQQMANWFSQPFVVDYTKTAELLQKVQKEIDRCNNKLGCNKMCRESQQTTCCSLHRHAELVYQLRYIHDFLEIPIEYVERR